MARDDPLPPHSFGDEVASAAALAARAAGGVAVDVANFGNMTPQFRTWNRRLYSPLCAVLSIGALASLRRRPTGALPGQ